MNPESEEEGEDNCGIRIWDSEMGDRVGNVVGQCGSVRVRELEVPLSQDATETSSQASIRGLMVLPSLRPWEI